jgi:hypothetical protein
LLNWTLLFRKIAATKTLLPVIAKAKKKKDENYEITTTTNNMQTRKKNRKFSSLKKPFPKALRLMPVA